MFWFLCLLNIQLVYAETPVDVQALLSDVFTNGVYNKDIRGQDDLLQTMNVDLKFALRSINRFDEAAETLDVMGIVFITWTDKRLTWDPEKYNNTKKVQVRKDIVWTPYILLANPAESVSSGIIGDTVSIDHHGNVQQWQVDVFQVKCPAIVTRFPFDQQSCGILFAIGGYTNREVNLTSSLTRMITFQFQENGIWDLKDTWVIKPNFSYSSMLEFGLTIERKEAFFVVNILVPPVILGFLGVLVFLIPIESGERISYCITILLTVGIFLNLVSDYLPANSVKMASICYLLLLLFIESTLICLCSIVSVRMYHQELTGIERWIISHIANVCKHRKEKQNNIQIKDDNDSCIWQNDMDAKGGIRQKDEQMDMSIDMVSQSKDEKSANMWETYSKQFDGFCFVVFLLLNAFSIFIFMCMSKNLL